MRDPKRIKPFLEELEKLWSKVPDQRFGQLVINYLLSGNVDPFYVEDDEMLERIHEAEKDLPEYIPHKPLTKAEILAALAKMEDKIGGRKYK